MQLIEYISDRERRAQLARDANTDSDYLWQIATGWRGKRPSPALANRIERHTMGLVTRESLRPDVFAAPRADNAA